MRSLPSIVVTAIALLIALIGARTYPGGWNDASRLATVESLVDQHTFAIDASIFSSRTADKLQIGDRFYSDKPPVSAVAALLQLALLHLRDRRRSLAVAGVIVYGYEYRFAVYVYGS